MSTGLAGIVHDRKRADGCENKGEDKQKASLHL